MRRALPSLKVCTCSGTAKRNRISAGEIEQVPLNWYNSNFGGHAKSQNRSTNLATIEVRVCTVHVVLCGEQLPNKATTNESIVGCLYAVSTGYMYLHVLCCASSITVSIRHDGH